jgi:hypothetical protein
MPVNVNRSGIVQVSQPVRKMQKKKTLWILVVIAAVASLVVWRLVAPRSASQQRLTVEGVRKQLEKVTPVGSSRSAVAGYLDSQSIQHSYIEDSKFPNERRVELALIRGTSKSQLVRGDIQIRFQFDEFGRLLNYSVREVLYRAITSLELPRRSCATIVVEKSPIHSLTDCVW